MNEQNKRVSAFCSDALGNLDGVGIAERISSGEISAAEAVDAAIARAKSVNPALNAIVTETFDTAARRLKILSPALLREYLLLSKTMKMCRVLRRYGAPGLCQINPPENRADL